ncbi:MAG: thermonuclease family protein, partial [Cytophagaceae bacterium]
MLTSILLCLVVGVSDGDTLKARCGQPGAYEQVTIRLAEIDAPEKSQPFGQRSKDHLSDLCFGKQAE